MSRPLRREAGDGLIAPTARETWEAHLFQFPQNSLRSLIDDCFHLGR